MFIGVPLADVVQGEHCYKARLALHPEHVIPWRHVQATETRGAGPVRREQVFKRHRPILCDPGSQAQAWADVQDIVHLTLGLFSSYKSIKLERGVVRQGRGVFLWYYTNLYRGQIKAIF